MLWSVPARYGGIWDPLSEVQRIQRDMDRFFSSVRRPYRREFPAISIWMGKNDNICVTAEMPGIDPKEVEVSVVDETLTISGSCPQEELKEGEIYRHQERSVGRFARAIQLPFRVEADKVDAKYDRGVLYITLLRAESDKPKRIPVRAG